MSSVHNCVETVNAAATAIVTAESRVQPSTVQKKRWRSCWSIYSCFGSRIQTKKIGHAILISEPSGPRTLTPISENRNPSSSSSSSVIPFIAPPSSPGGLLSLLAHPPCGPASIFAVGPYANETQLVSQPVFSAFTTEPSTASFTPPPEPDQMTTPSSPEVPFAQLLSSSLARTRSNIGPYSKLPLSHSPSTSSNLISIRIASPPGRRFLLPEPHQPFFPIGPRSSLGSQTPNGSNDRVSNDNKVASSECKPQNEDLVDNRVSFEFFGEEIPTCIVRAPSLRKIKEGPDEPNLGSKNQDSFREHFNGETMNEEEFHQKHRTISLGSSKDFNFNNENGEVSEKSSINCEW
ncbi:hypothetical protein CASFOL_002080 [Castilleja foliolosa]|uniref:Hydroxyproline-rich glycoprotein family protein n=1 Tax=Castilleja foliolosa TaxID=1961234 RepID=A0ABD3EH85_9LAMI